MILERIVGGRRIFGFLCLLLEKSYYYLITKASERIVYPCGGLSALFVVYRVIMEQSEI